MYGIAIVNCIRFNLWIVGTNDTTILLQLHSALTSSGHTALELIHRAATPNHAHTLERQTLGADE